MPFDPESPKGGAPLVCYRDRVHSGRIAAYATEPQHAEQRPDAGRLWGNLDTHKLSPRRPTEGV